MIWLTCSLLVLATLPSFSLQCSSGSSSGCSCLNFTDCKASNDTGKVVFCYFTNWAWYRTAPANFRPENINASLCTHILYAFAIVNTTTLEVVPSDSWADYDNYFFKNVTAFRAKGLKVLLSVGGWTNSAADHWSRMMTNTTTRQIFIKSAYELMKNNDFDGIDIDNEYPACPQGNRTAAGKYDINNFVLLVSELKTKLDGKYLLTLATSAGKTTIKNCYNMTALVPYVDYFNVMAYEYHSSSDGETGAIAPLCGTNTSWGVYDTIKYYIDTVGCPASKLVLGIPFYGASFKLSNASNVGFGVPVSGKGTAGTYTGAAGILSYMEICYLVKEKGYSVGYNSINNSYAYKDTEFVAYDNVVTVAKKTCFINKYFNLAGAMFWALDYDDFNNVCGCGSYPLLKTLNYYLGRTNSTISGTCY